MPTLSLTAQAVADLVGGRLSGNGALVLTGVAPLESAGGSDLSLLTSPRYLGQFAGSRAGCVLLPPEFADHRGEVPARIVVDRPQAALQAVLAALHTEAGPPPGVHPTAVLGAGVLLGDAVALGPRVVVGDGVRLGDRVVVGAGAVIEAGAEVGADSVLGSNVTVCRAAVIGRRVRVKAGAVIGGQGFGYLSGPEGHQRIPHVGGCRIEDDVDIGANSCVDRGSIGDTVVGRGSKLDNLVHVAHNVRIGEGCLLMAGAMVAGSTRLGRGVILAGQAGVVGHLELGDGVRVAAQTGVISSVPAGTEVSGFPGRPHREHMRAVAAMYRLAPVARRLEALARSADRE